MTKFEFLRREPDIGQYRQGDTIFNRGDSANCLYGVVKGSVGIELGGGVSEHIQPLTIFDEMALIDELPRSATARAAIDCSLAFIDKKILVRRPFTAPTRAFE